MPMTTIMPNAAITPAAMKTLQITFIATVLIASAHALLCNVGVTGNCPSQAASAGMDLCWKCTYGGATFAGACATSGGCLTGSKDDCVITKKGTWFSCNTDNCNGCSPASSLQISALLLSVAIMLLSAL